jgi:hypothetical protein
MAGIASISNMSDLYLQIKNAFYSGNHAFICGYYPDVMTKDGSIVIECGHTNNPEKMLHYFRQSNTRECIQIPYPDESNTAILGYSFTTGTELHGFLGFLESEKHSAVKKLILKRKAGF